MHPRRLLRLVSALAVVSGLLMVSAPSTGASSIAGTITFAERPGANPNFIFPYLGCAYASINNINQFQELMYRPLYWFGLGSSVALQPNLSMAKLPIFRNHNRTVVIKMKGWKFADGQVINAESVMFFLNMYKSVPSSYCGYNAGYGIPDQVSSAFGTGDTVTINFKVPVNHNWITYNYLSEITPMPNLWDRVSATTMSNCATGQWGASSTSISCKNVEAYLTAQSTNTKTFTNSMWQGGDSGPWRLTSFDASGNATFQPNSKYSGPQEAQVRFVKEIAFSSIQAEENDLTSGKLSIGYLDPSVLASPAPIVGKPGPNWGPVASLYSMATGSSWSFNYATFNFTASNPDVTPIDYLYVRQALQYAVDQTGIIHRVDKGYGSVIYSPLPPNTPRLMSSPIADPYPYNLAAARSLLRQHGWTIQNGVQICTSPGTKLNQCGANIALNTTLKLNVVWVSGSPSLDQTFNTEIASWQSIGIQVTHSVASYNSVISDCTGATGFELCSWGEGWTYPPNYYPSGESLLKPNSVFNVGAYSSAQMTSLINATTNKTSNLTAYSNYAAEQLPVLYQPQSNVINEVVKTLRSSVGIVPSPLGNFTPEYFHF